MSGPPWPVLVASGPYTPPPLIRWPVAAGVAALAVYLLFVILTGTITISVGRNTLSHQKWLAQHEATIGTLNRDQTALNADKPTSPSGASKWLADWRTFHADAVGAASLPNPGGNATVPWREMLNDYATGSAEIIQALDRRDAEEISEAQRDLMAGDQAARRFNQAMGIRSS